MMEPMDQYTKKGILRAWPAKKRWRCDLETCNKLYWPKKPNQRFCTDACKREYHFGTPTFRKFRDDMEALVRKMVKPEALKVLKERRH